MCFDGVKLPSPVLQCVGTRTANALNHVTQASPSRSRMTVPGKMSLETFNLTNVYHT